MIYSSVYFKFKICATPQIVVVQSEWNGAFFSFLKANPDIERQFKEQSPADYAAMMKSPTRELLQRSEDFGTHVTTSKTLNCVTNDHSILYCYHRYLNHMMIVRLWVGRNFLIYQNYPTSQL